MGAQQLARLRKKQKWGWRQVCALLLSLIPLIGFILFSFAPLIISFVALFYNVNLNPPYDRVTGMQPDFTFTWNSFEGFKAVFMPGYSYNGAYEISKYFGQSLLITLWIAATQLVTLLIALIISVLLASKPKGGKVFQILYFVPYICSSAAVAIMWRWIFSLDSAGILNTLLGTSRDWLRTTESSLTWAIVLATIWQAPGYGIVMYKAAIANVSSSLYEAASLDGANGFQKFRHVTLPGIAPTTFYLLLAGVGAGLLSYDIPSLMMGGGTGGWNGWNEDGSMGRTLMVLIRGMMDDTVSEGLFVSAASVMSWFLFVITAALSFVILRKRDKSMEG